MLYKVKGFLTWDEKNKDLELSLMSLMSLVPGIDNTHRHFSTLGYC